MGIIQPSTRAYTAKKLGKIRSKTWGISEIPDHDKAQLRRVFNQSTIMADVEMSVGTLFLVLALGLTLVVGRIQGRGLGAD